MRLVEYIKCRGVPRALRTRYQKSIQKYNELIYIIQQIYPNRICNFHKAAYFHQKHGVNLLGSTVIPASLLQLPWNLLKTNGKQFSINKDSFLAKQYNSRLESSAAISIYQLCMLDLFRKALYFVDSIKFLLTTELKIPKKRIHISAKAGKTVLLKSTEFKVSIYTRPSNIIGFQGGDALFVRF